MHINVVKCYQRQNVWHIVPVQSYSFYSCEIRRWEVLTETSGRTFFKRFSPSCLFQAWTSYARAVKWCLKAPLVWLPHLCRTASYLPSSRRLNCCVRAEWRPPGPPRSQLRSRGLSAASPIYKNTGLLLFASCLERPFSLRLCCLFCVIAIFMPSGGALRIPCSPPNPPPSILERALSPTTHTVSPEEYSGAWLVKCFSQGGVYQMEMENTRVAKRHPLARPCKCGCSQSGGTVGRYQSVSVTLELAAAQTAKSKQVIHSGITTERSLFNSLFNICLSFHEHISKTSAETLLRW